MSASTVLSVTRLRCEYQVNPLGVGERLPRLSWELASARRGAGQRAYRILVASAPELLAREQGDLWDSGTVVSDETAQIPYGGTPLASRQQCWWQVRVTDETGALSAWSDIARWEMGLLDDAEWQAQWISHAPDEADANPRPGFYFRKPFATTGEVVRARVYATARGIYELWVNGQRVGDEVFQPGWTEYHTRLHVQTYDLGDLLTPGENVIGAVLGEGWYCGRVGWDKNRNIYGDRPELYVQLELTYADGRREVIGSDASWRYNTGPIHASGFLLGETYDARREMPGWSAPGFDASAWRTPATAPRDTVIFEHSFHPPVRPIMELPTQEIITVEPGVYLFDLGQNMVGRARLRVNGPAGTQVTLRFGEMRYPDGRLYVENLRAATSIDTYTLRGGGEEVYEPTFTFHGFRYVEVSGFPGVPGPEAITGVVLHSDAPVTGEFSCSHPLVNKLYQNILWGQRGNFVEVPTDCPQRDERLGWMGDAQIFAGTACFNMDLAAFFTKWMDDVNDAQLDDGFFTLVAPNIIPTNDEQAKAMNFSWDVLFSGMAAWGDAGVIVPWTVYRYYGDARLLERCYPHMTKWIEYLDAHSTDHLRPAEGFGDWLSIGADTPLDVLATAYYAYVTRLVAQVAAVLGKPEDAAKFQQHYEAIRAAFNAAYVAPDARIKGDTQTVYLLALHFDLLPQELRPLAVAHLAADIRAHDNHLTSGFVGISYLLPVLTEAGELDLAYALLTQETYPSWLYPVLQGATTVWERWDGWTEQQGFQDPGMNSFNHYALGAVGEWLYTSATGIAPDPQAPGFTRAIIHPRVHHALDFVQGSYHSQHGRYAVRWERNDGQLTLAVTIPPNCAATLHLPATTPEQVRENGTPLAEAEGITAIRTEKGEVICEATAGTYCFLMG